MISKVRLFGVCVVIAGAAVSVACGSSDDSKFGDGSAQNGGAGSSGANGFGNGTDGDGTGTTQQKIEECSKMDIVFAVDNSNSMKEEQDNLAANFPKFVNVIDSYKTKSGQALDYRIAVTTSDDKGKFLSARGPGAIAGCNPGPKKAWLERTDGTVADFFACRAEVGTGGSSTERPIENILLGVRERVADGTNAGFVRDDALLAIVILTDEDEGSKEGAGNLARPMADYPPAFDTIKSGRGRWAAAAIAGPGPGDCTSSFGAAAEAKRVHGFTDSAGQNGVFSSICAGDLTEGLTKALATFDQACKNFPTGPVK